MSLLDRVFVELRRARGIDLSAYRRGTLQRRLNFRMARLGLNDPREYLELLQSDSGERDRLIETLTVDVSSFFRNPFVFEYLAQYVLPEILERKRAGFRREIRVWSAGCATGEEPYSAAILLSCLLEEEGRTWVSYIFATDINQKALDAARAGVYSWEKLKEVKLGMFERFFVFRDLEYGITPRIRAMVNFSFDNLVAPDRFAPADSVYGGFDLILCRNVLIYFSLALQKEVQIKIARALTEGGYLVLGDCEALHPDVLGQFKVLDPRCRVYQKKKSILEDGA